MVFLARVIIVNLDIFNKHGVKQSYVINIYSIYKATNQKLANLETSHFRNFRLVNNGSVCVIGWTPAIILIALFCNFTNASIYDLQESPHTWLQ